MGAAGAKYAFIAPRDTVPGSQHVMGTLRSGTDATMSVTNNNGLFWDVGNLYAADGSLFPTSSGHNPDHDDRGDGAARRGCNGESHVAELHHSNDVLTLWRRIGG